MLRILYIILDQSLLFHNITELPARTRRLASEHTAYKAWIHLLHLFVNCVLMPLFVSTF